MPETDIPDGAIEIACDESGAEGEKLAYGGTRLFSHASVLITTEQARECLAGLRRRIRSPATQYKATHLLRPQHRSTLEWFLGPEGPVCGRSRVVVLDKEEFLLHAFVALASADRPASEPGWLVKRDWAGRPEADGGSGGATARWLLAEVADALGDRGRRALLTSLDAILRGRPVDAGPTPVAALDRLIAGLRGVPGAARSLAWLTARRPAIGALADRQSRGNPTRVIVNPLFWAVARTVEIWDGRTRPVSVVHDRQLSVTPTWITELVSGCPVGDRAPAPAGLVGFTMVPSATEPRVQVADFMAGIARRTLTAALAGAPDPELMALLKPYLDLFPPGRDPFVQEGQ